MKMLLIKYLLPFIMEEIVKILKQLAVKSDNTIDDRIVAEIEKNKDAIINAVK